MADITMCKGTHCLLKETCYRHTAPAAPYHQSYFVEPPYEVECKGEIKCGYYWEDTNGTDRKQTKH